MIFLGLALGLIKSKRKLVPLPVGVWFDFSDVTNAYQVSLVSWI
jgi:hypothetical protein